MAKAESLQLDNRQLQHIARISHGKDSLKMLDVIVSRGLPLDRITTTDIWATDTIRGEHPKMVTFKDHVDEYIWQKYRIEVEHLCAMKNGEKVTYEKMFYHVPKRKEGRKEGSSDFQCCGEHGARPHSKQECGHRPQGFPAQIGSWCKKLKIEYIRIPNFYQPKRTMVHKAQNAFLESPATRGGKNIVEYIGIAADEPKRFAQLNQYKRAPLVEFGIEEDLCGVHCQYERILAPSYDTSCRDGCWMCHNQGVNSLRLLRKDYPELWELLLKWDKDSPVDFHPDGRTVHDYDRRFQAEDDKLIFADEHFFWSKLDDPMLNYRWF